MLKIMPENLTVANLYLENQSVEKTAAALDLSVVEIKDILDTPEVKRYIDAIFLDSGYRNRFKLADMVDDLIQAKITEVGIHSDKDLLDLLKFAHLMRVQEEKRAGPDKQTNVQINDFGSPSNYSDLVKRLMS